MAIAGWSRLFKLLNSLLNDLIDEPEFLRTLRSKELIALQCLLNSLDRLTGVPDIDFIQPLADVEDLLGVNHDVGGLALKAPGRLVNHDAGIGQRKPHVLLPSREQQGTHRRSLA